MGRPLMFQEREWQVFELTMRCHQGRFLLRPGDEANLRLAGVLGRSLELYGDDVKVLDVAGISSHIHLLVMSRSANANFNAGGIATESHGSRPRDRKAPSDSPKAHEKHRRNANTTCRQGASSTVRKFHPGFAGPDRRELCCSSVIYSR